MSFVDATKLGAGELVTDVCIVGAGAAGLTIAGEVAGWARELCLIESGGTQPDEETQALYDLENAGYPIRENFMSRARYYGGSCNLWAGRCMKLDEADMARREWVPYSGWPIPYPELAAYYPAAARLLRLPPVQQFEPCGYPERMSAEERRLFSQGPLTPAVSLWAKNPVRFGVAYRPRLRRAGNVRVLLHANVTKLNVSREGAWVESVDVTTLAGNTVQVRAKVFVLACGALENARLLLASRDRHPAGIGNQFDLVGRFFMDHPRAVFGTVRVFSGCRLPLLRGMALRDGKVQIGIGPSREVQAQEGLLDHYATLEAQVSQYTAAQYQSLVQLLKVFLRRGYAGSWWRFRRARLGEIPGLVYLLTAKEIMPHSLFRCYRTLQNALNRRPRERTCVVVYFCEQPPDRESRVTLSPDRDRLGMNKLRLEWRLGPEIVRSVMRLQELLQVGLKEAGVGEVETGDAGIGFTDASHHMGTTRMSDDPKSGVVDRNCRVHGIRNLFVAGGSVFPSAGHKNPTLTIVALALRLADYLKRRGF
jgi:choline dehydrogenase-like flavoprotein